MKVMIAGAGVAGLSLARALSRRGHRVVVVEKSPALRGASLLLDLSGIGHVALEKLGILDRLTTSGWPIERLIFHGGDGGELASLPYASLRGSTFRGRHLIVTRGQVEEALYASVRADVDIRFGVSIEEVALEGTGVRLSLSDGSSPFADLLVGADGVRSTVRAMTFALPEESFRRFLGYRVLAFVIEDERFAQALGPAVHVMALNGRQVMVVAAPHGVVGCLLIHKSSESPQDRTRKSALDELRREYGRIAWAIPILQAHAERLSSIHFDGIHEAHVPQWSAGPVVLVGDAAHGASLLAGHGASLALAGSVTLAEEIEAGQSGAALRYEKRMRPIVAAVQRAGREAGPWLVPDGSLALLRHRMASRLARWPFASRVVRGAAAAAAAWDAR